MRSPAGAEAAADRPPIRDPRRRLGAPCRLRRARRRRRAGDPARSVVGHDHNETPVIQSELCASVWRVGRSPVEVVRTRLGSMVQMWFRCGPHKAWIGDIVKDELQAPKFVRCKALRTSAMFSTTTARSVGVGQGHPQTGHHAKCGRALFGATWALSRARGGKRARLQNESNARLRSSRTECCSGLRTNVVQVQCGGFKSEN